MIESLKTNLYVKQEIESRFLQDLNSVKQFFLDCLKYYCADFEVDDSNREIIVNIFHWCVRDKNGAYNPNKGLWLYGEIGNGKSTIMKAILRFISKCWLCDSGTRINATWESAINFCHEYSQVGICTFQDIPVGIDEIGSEYTPTYHNGNKLNVISYMISNLYDNNVFPRIVTTNYNFTEIRERYGSMVVDRIGHLFNPVKVEGATRRKSSLIWNLIELEQKNLL